MAISRKTYVSAALIIVVLGVSLWFALGMMRASVGYRVCAEFESMPAEDTALADWLRAQPDVVPSTVDVFRKGKKLEVFYIISVDVRFSKKLPDIESRCRALGYDGPIGPFRDCDEGELPNKRAAKP